MKRIDGTYVQIDLDVMEQNLIQIRKRAGVPVMAVIKADAYGHGAVPVAKYLERLCSFFGVSSMEEARELRNAGVTLPILVLGHTPISAYHNAVRLQIRPTIWNLQEAEALSREAQRQNCVAPFHFAVDTGMSRIGFQVTEEEADLCARIANLPNLQAEGLFSHFATADSEDLSFTLEQAALYDRFLGMLRDRGIRIPLCHLDNSAGIMNSSYHRHMVRAGIVLYGMYPSEEVDPQVLPIRPVMSWHSYVSHVKEIEPGRTVGYGATFTAQRLTRVATVPVGYADGYRRSLSGKFYVLIRGQKAPILGRICMDQMMVDVTDIPEAALYDPVVLVGSQGDQTITMEQIAQAAGSFHYEFASGISRRVPKLYVSGGEILEQVHYLLR